MCIYVYKIYVHSIYDIYEIYVHSPHFLHLLPGIDLLILAPGLS